jgi:hypothetical protein
VADSNFPPKPTRDRFVLSANFKILNFESDSKIDLAVCGGVDFWGKCEDQYPAVLSVMCAL